MVDGAVVTDKERGIGHHEVVSPDVGVSERPDVAVEGGEFFVPDGVSEVL